MKARRVRTAELLEGDGWIEDGDPWFQWWLTPGTPAWSEMADIVESMALSEEAIGNPYGRIP